MQIFWITQTNENAPCNTCLVTKALNFHFCAPPESFIVNLDLLLVYPSSVASNVVKLHLIRISVFALDRIIFRIHGDRQAAISDASTSAVTFGTGKDSKFETQGAHRA